MTKTTLVSTIGVALFATTVYAQVPKMVKVPEGGMVPCDHPLAIKAGLSCEKLSEAPTDPTINTCTGNPYTNPQCFLDNAPQKFVDNGWRFQIGKTYLHPYYGLSVTILGMLVNISGQSVFIGQTVDHVLREYPIGSNPQQFDFYKEQ